MKEEILENIIASPIQELLAIFKKELSNVEFPDVNHGILENCIKNVENSAKELAKAVAQEKAAGEALEASQNELLQKAVRGLAYAKVYAEDRPEIMEKLSQINLGKSARISRKTVDKKVTEDAPEAAEKSDEKKHARSTRKAADSKVADEGEGKVL